MDAADHAASAAANAVNSSFWESTLEPPDETGVAPVHLDAATARDYATAALNHTPRPQQISHWQVEKVEVRADSVRVQISAEVRPRLLGSTLSQLGLPVHINISASARLQ